MNSFDGNKIRIAVCYSGQARHWQTGVENNLKFFGLTRHLETGQEIEVDYFIHTWDRNTWRFPKQKHNQYEIVKHDDADAIKAAYNPKGFICQEFNEEEFPRAWDPMFYSHARSLMLKRDYELKNNMQYDVVVKARLDVIYPPSNPFPLRRVWPGICYSCTPISKFTSEFNYNNFDDVLFYGDSPTMDLVGDIYSKLKQQHTADYVAMQSGPTNIDVTLWYGPGCLLYDHCTDLGIHPDGSKPIEYAVIRSTAVDENLKGIDDYDKIRKKWFEWYI